MPGRGETLYLVFGLPRVDVLVFEIWFASLVPFFFSLPWVSSHVNKTSYHEVLICNL